MAVRSFTCRPTQPIRGSGKEKVVSVVVSTAQPSSMQQAPNPAVVDLLGVLSYAELTAFHRLAMDAAFAPTLADKASLSQMAVDEFGHFTQIRARLEQLGADPEQAMRPFVAVVEQFHHRTQPQDWLEGLIKAYVGDSIGREFYQAIASYVDPQTREVIISALAPNAHADFAVERVRQAIVADPRVAGRLALWGRRLVGEALSHAQQVAQEHDNLAALIATRGGQADGIDVEALAQVFTQLTQNHTKRMAALGLAA